MDKKAGLVLVGAISGIFLLGMKASAAGEYICPVCGEEFTSQTELIEHMTSEHPGARIPITIRWD